MNTSNRTISTFLLLFLLLFIPTQLFSQKDSVDVVYLHNGSVIKGKVLEENELTVRIETLCENIWVFEKSRVDSVIRVPGGRSYAGSNLEGYENQLFAGFIRGERYSRVAWSFQMINSYYIKKRMSAGIGIGIETFDVPVLPVFAEAKYYFIKNRVTPFVYFQGGYSFAIRDLEYWYGDAYNSKGGICINPGLGIRFNFNKNADFVIGLAYRHQRIKHIRISDDSANEFPNSRLNIYDRVAFHVGFQFR